MADLEKIGEQLAKHVDQTAKSNGPGAVLLTVVDGSGQMATGYVWCTYGDKTVQCIAPANVADMRTATADAPMLIWAIPPNPGSATDAYVAIGFAQNGASSNGFPPSRVPPITGSVINDPDGNPISGSGTVTSVALSMPSPFSVSGSPITGAGTFTVSQPSPFVETQGGTGQSTYTQGDILYASAANTLSKLAKGTNGFFLKIGATIPAWAQVFYQTIKKAGSAATQRSNINFIDGANISITVADNAGTDATDITIASTASGNAELAEILAWTGIFT